MVSMDDNAKSMKYTMEIRIIGNNEPTIHLNTKGHRKVRGKLNYLSENVRQDLCHNLKLVLIVKRGNN